VLPGFRAARFGSQNTSSQTRASAPSPKPFCTILPRTGLTTGMSAAFNATPHHGTGTT